MLGIIESFEAKYPDPCPTCPKKETGICPWCDYHRSHKWLMEGAKGMLDLLVEKAKQKPELVSWQISVVKG